MAIRIRGTDFVYFPVPKVGCTALKLAIMRHNDPRKFARLRGEEDVHGGGGYRSPPWSWEWRAYLRPRSMRAFCIIRDPIDRFVSGYRNRILHWRDLGDERVPEINEFALHLEDHCRSSRHIRHHFLPMVAFTGRGADFYDRVFLLHELEQIGKYLGLPLSIERAQEGGPPMKRSDLSSEAIDHLRDFYADDFRAWGQHLTRQSA